jgi:hypothetical protein
MLGAPTNVRRYAAPITSIHSRPVPGARCLHRQLRREHRVVPFDDHTDDAAVAALSKAVSKELTPLEY